MAEGKRPNTKQIARRVIEVVEAELVTAGFELLDVRVFQGGGRYQLRLFVDLIPDEAAVPVVDEDNQDEKPEGVNMAQVAKASRTANMLLEEADLFVGEYIIEVSSPGIRRPIRTLEHYQQAIGKRVDLRITGIPAVSGSYKPYRVRGVLQSIVGDELQVLPPATEATDDDGDVVKTEATVMIKWDWILEGNLDPEFDAQAIINADRRERKDEKKRIRKEKASGKKKGRPKNRSKDRPQEDGGST